MVAAARAAIAVNSSMKASHALASKTATGRFLGFFLGDFAPPATAGGGLSGRGGFARFRPRHDCRIAWAMTPPRQDCRCPEVAMSDRMTAPPTISALDLAALLCSRVCHDLISPVGAIINGLEVMDEDKDEETKTVALDLIKKSAGQASAKLQFCRLAFGASGSAGAQIELGDAEKAARGLLDDGKATLVWNLPR